MNNQPVNAKSQTITKLEGSINARGTLDGAPDTDLPPEFSSIEHDLGDLLGH
jgi:hypothetical protein